MIAINSKYVTSYRKQRTLVRPVTFSGIGVHTGQEVNMRFCPAEENSGVNFKRIDLPDQPIIPASVKNVCDTARSTTIGIANNRIHTVEHVLAAVRAYEIDNLLIEVSNIEPPISDGNSISFVEMIESAGIAEQQAKVPIVKIETPIYWSEKDIHLVALPYDGYKLSYTLNYPDTQVLRAQFHSIELSPANFKKEIAPCRTFSLYNEVAILMERGLIKGGSLDNAVVIKDNAILSKNGLHFPDEMARHKILDMIGDLALVGVPFHAHVIAIRAGHASNYQLAKKIYEHIGAPHG